MTRPRPPPAAAAVALGLALLGAILALAPARAAAAAAEPPDARGPEPTALATAPGAPWRVRLPPEATREVELDEADWSAAGSFELALRLDPAPTGGRTVRLLLFLQTREGWWYQTARTAAVGASGALRLSLPLDAATFEPSGHCRPLDRAALRRVARCGLKLFSDAPYAGAVEVADMRVPGARPRADEAELLDASRPPPDLAAARVYDLALPAGPVRIGERFELAFRLDPEPADPFDPRLDLRAELRGPDGLVRAAPAFFDQAYLAVPKGGRTALAPWGPPRWKVRLRPRLAGAHELRLYAGEKLLAAARLEVLPAVKSAAAEGGRPAGPGDLAFTVRDGESFVLDLAAAASEAPPLVAAWRRGGWESDERLAPPARAWTVPLAWTRRWGKWDGRRGFDLELAWRFDRVLEAAERAGESLPLALLDERLFHEQGPYRWSVNPLAAEEGGPLAGPGEYFRREESRAALARLARYALARWGDSTAVAGWLLAARLPAAGAEEWHAALGAELARLYDIADDAAGDAAGRPLLALHPQAVAPQGRVELAGTPLAAAPRGEFDPWSTARLDRWQPDPDSSGGAPARLRLDEVAAEELAPPRAGTPVYRLSWTPSVAARADAGEGGAHAFGRRHRRRSEPQEPAGPQPAAGAAPTGPPPAPKTYVGASRELDADLFDCRRLTLAFRLPPEAPPGARVLVWLRDGSLRWYEQLLEEPLRPGDWTTCLVELDPDATGATGAARWTPRGHALPWTGYSRERLREVGFRVFLPSGCAGPLNFADAAFEGAPARLVARERPVALDFLEPPAAEVGRYAKFELAFKLSKTYANPFDPERVNLVARFRAPSGQTTEVPGFFYQPCRRRLDGDRELVEPAGAPCWKVRFAPRETGRYAWSVEVREGDRTWDPEFRAHFPQATPPAPVARTEEHSLVVAPSTARGFLRAAASGGGFEHETGEFFWPVGLNLRSPADTRDIRPELAGKVAAAATRGTYQYDDYFRAFQAHGLNWARVWSCSWWCGLEWDRRFPGYDGIGRYHQENAWRLDHLFEEAERRGVWLQLDLMNHGQLSTNIDHEWENHPYNLYEPWATVLETRPGEWQVYRGQTKRELLAQGLRLEHWQFPPAPPGGTLEDRRRDGFLAEAGDYFTDERAARLHRQRLRYYAARWGYSTHLFGWTLTTEAEFFEPYWVRAYDQGDRNRVLAAWQKRTRAALAALDPFGHPITSHYSHPQRGHLDWETVPFDYLQSNAYSTFPWFGGDPEKNVSIGAPPALELFYQRYMKGFGRPVLVAEWGGHWLANPPERLAAELHQGCWAEAVSPLAGTTGFWWWPWVHFGDHYGPYQAVGRFMAGEDRRGRKLAWLRPPVAGARGQLQAQAVAWDDGADLYVYNIRELQTREGVPAVRGASCALAGLADGVYAVACYDTDTGKVTETREAESRDGRLELALPVVPHCLAAKLRRARDLPPPPPPPLETAEPPPASPPASPPAASPPAEAEGPDELKKGE